MKKLLIFLLLTITFLSFSKSSIALSPTPTNSVVGNQIDELKTKIASKVAQLNLVEKRGIIGTVTDSSDTQITVNDTYGNIRIIDVDEITKFSSDNSNSFGISDIKTGTLLGILGLYNKQSKRLLARQVNELSPNPKVIYGGISLIDSKNYELTVVKENEKKEILEITDLTRTNSYSGGTLTKSGFSKVKLTSTVLAIGYTDKKDSTKTLASRIIIFPNVDLTSRINLSPSIAPTIQPSTGSGVKLFPIKK